MTHQPKTILVVDDEAAIRRLSQRVLQRLGFATLEEENGEQGLSRISRDPDKVDGVLLDLHLPDGAGTEWAEKFRAIRPDLPIIFFTGSNPPQHPVLGETKRSYYLKKPFTPDSVSKVLQSVFP